MWLQQFFISMLFCWKFLELLKISLNDWVYSVKPGKKFIVPILYFVTSGHNWFCYQWAFWVNIRVYHFKQWSEFGFWSLWSRISFRSLLLWCWISLMFFLFHCFLLMCCVDNPLYFCCWNFLFPSLRKPPKVSTDMKFGMYTG